MGTDSNVMVERRHEGSEDDVGVANPVNVRDEVIAVPCTDGKQCFDGHIRYSVVVEPEVYNRNRKSSLEGSKALSAQPFRCPTRRSHVSLCLSVGAAEDVESADLLEHRSVDIFASGQPLGYLFARPC